VRERKREIKTETGILSAHSSSGSYPMASLCIPYQNPDENVALSSGRPHLFGSAFQLAFSKQLNQSKTKNLKHSNSVSICFLESKMRSEQKLVKTTLICWYRRLIAWIFLLSTNSHISKVRSACLYAI
jgi:hypothetical protein